MQYKLYIVYIFNILFLFLGACFCVDINSGEVDESTKTQGSANCDAINNETADSTTQLYTTSSIPEWG